MIHLFKKIFNLCQYQRKKIKKKYVIIKKLKFFYLVEHLSYPRVNLWINYARTDKLYQNCKMPTIWIFSNSSLIHRV